MTDPKIFDPILKRWITSSAYGLVIIVVCLILSLYVLPVSDQWSLFRYFVLRVPASIYGIIAITGGVLFFDWITPGDWLKNSEEGSIACSIVLVGIIAAIACVICYT